MRRLFSLLICVVAISPLFAQEICNNGKDDDGDGKVDCYDGDCSDEANCDGFFIVDADCQIDPPPAPAFTMQLDFSSDNETTNHFARMAIGDLDRDGMPEIITMNKYTNKLIILNGNDGSVKNSVTMTAGATPEWEIAIANINNDNCAEIFFLGTDSRIYVYDCGLNFLYRTNQMPNGSDPINFGIADFDGDGFVEIYCKDQIFDAHSGRRLVATTKSSNNWSNSTNGGPVAVDMNNDGKLELVLGLSIFTVNIPIPARGTDAGSLSAVVPGIPVTSRPEYFIRNEYNATSVADIDFDGQLDVIASGSTGCNGKNTTIFYWNVGTNTLKTYSDHNSIDGDSDYRRGWKNGTGRVNIADLDGDGQLNFSYVSGGFLYALKQDMTKLWRVAINEETSGYTGCTLFDFNGDGKAEIVYRDEQYLYIIDGTDGSIFNQQNCVSRTNREYPIVADVDADGSTEICVTCGFDDALALANFNTTSYSQYSHVRVFKSAAEPWVPARRVWNQHGYFVVNVNDDLTIPKQQTKHNTLFQNTSCRPGDPARDQRPLNKFLNQSPYLDDRGCPAYSAPDIAFATAVTFKSPTCPDLDFKVTFKITNSGDVAFTGDLPISFYTSNPSKPGATKLNTLTFPIDNLTKDQVLNIDTVVINSGGSDSLFVVLNDGGTTIPTPITLPNTSIIECDYDNIRGVAIRTKPAKLTAIALTEHENCAAPPTGSARAFVLTGGAQNTTDYDFYWFDGAVAGAIGTEDKKGPIYTELVNGPYRVYAVHKTALCSSDTTNVTVTLAAGSGLPAVSVSLVSNQTACNPPNGSLQATVAGPGGNAGYTFEWLDNGSIPIGVTSATLTTQPAGTYKVEATKNGCTTTNEGTIGDLTIEPDITATPTHVTNCSNLSSGSVTAIAQIAGVDQPATDYTFAWYFYDNVTATRGSVVPPVPNATGPTRTGLPVGFYEVVATRTTTQCQSPSPFVVQVLDQTSTPTVVISELAPQTSCDPLNPNGRLQATVSVGGIPQLPGSFTFEWFVGQNTLPANVHSTVSGTNGSIAEKVKGGGQAYTVKITTVNNCTATDDEVVTETINVPVVTLLPTPNGICNQALATTSTGLFTGSVTATVTFGGVNVPLPDPNYTFEWYDGTQATGPIIATTPNLTQRDSSYYTLVVKRPDIGCNATPKTAQVTNTTTLPVITTATTPSTNCNPALAFVDGTASVVTIDGGAAPGANFTYAWSGSVAPVFAVDNGTNHANTNQLVKVQGGAGYSYSVLVTNTNTGCQNTAAVNVADGKVLPVVTLAASDNHICAPATSFDGIVTASITPATIVGALTNYTFSFGGGMVAGTQLPSPNHNQYTKLNGGPTAYTVTATHTPTGCVSSQVSIPISNTQDLPVLTTASTPSTNCIVGLENGTASVVTVDGAATPGVNYTYAWSGSVAPAFALTATNNPNTHQLIKLQGGTGYNYSVLVTNTVNGCTNTANVNVADAKVLPVVTLAASDNHICAPATSFDGIVTASITPATIVGALTNYTFSFGGGMVAGTQLPSPNHNQYTKLNGGPTAYTVTATHTPTGCVSSQVSIPISNTQDLPVLTTASTPSTNCIVGLENGTASVVTVDGAATPGANYTYAWSGSVAPAFALTATNNPNTHQLIKLQGGTGYNYSVLVTNTVNGCTNTVNVNVADAKVLPVLALTPHPNSICNPLIATLGAFDGSIDAAVNNIPGGGTVNDYFFDWNVGTDGNGVDDLPNRDIGTYSVTATHNPTGCVSNVYSAQIITAKVIPAITMGQTPAEYCAGGTPDGIARVLNVVPNGKNYDYKWFDGNSTAGTAGPTTSNSTATTNNYPGVQGGINGVSLFEYTVEVTILQTGCVNTATIGVDNNSQVPIVTLQTPTDNTNCSPTKNGAAALNTLSYRGSPIAAPYTGFTFAWSAGGTVGAAPGETYTALAAGNYTLTVTNTTDNCISNPTPVTIVDKLFIPPIDVAAVNQTSCNPLTPNGSLTATINETTLPGSSGVTAGYTFGWVNDVTLGSTASNQITSLKGNQTYTITAVRNSTQCTNTRQVFLNESLITPTLVVNVTPLTICNIPNGSLSANVTPVGPTYSFFWYNGNDAADQDAVIAGADFTGGSVYSNLVPGDYTLVVRDNASECKSQQVIKTITNNAPVIKPLVANTAIPVDCSVAGGVLDAGIQLTASPNNFTTTAATNQLTTTTPLGLVLGDPVIITKTGVLPIPLEADKIYFVRTIVGNLVRLSLTPGGAVIDITVDGVGSIGDFKTAGHTYEWYAGVPSPTDPLLGSINFFTNPPVYTAGPLSPTSTLPGIPTGLYTVQITNTTTGCKTYLPHTLPFLGSHAVLKITKTNSTICPYTVGNGSIEIQIEDPVGAPAGVDQNDYDVTLFKGGVPIFGPFTPVPPINPFLVGPATISPGSYTVEVREKYSGFNCPISQDVIIDADAKAPVITLNSTTSNTACAITFDGEIEINVDKDPADLTTGSTYNIDMTPDPNAVFPLMAQPAGTYTALNLNPNNYSFTATSSTGCSATKSFVVLNTPVIAQFDAGDITITDAEYCSFILEQSAKVVVNELNLVGGGTEVLADYQFTWTNILTSTIVYTNQGDAAGNISGGDEFINQTPLPTDGTVAPGVVWKGSYSLKATKNADTGLSGGFGCTTPTFNLVIGSQFITPEIVLTPTGDTSCDPDPLISEGNIEADVTTASGPGTGGTYLYAWTPGGGVGQPASPVAGNSGVNNMFPNINDGAYTLTATNEITGCPASLATTVIKNPPPVFTVTADAFDLTNCDPVNFDGRINNIQVFIDGVGGNETDFDYTWFKTDLTGAPVIDGVDNITYPIDDQLTLATYPTIATATYFVKAIRKSGGLGIGCESAAIRKDILDARMFPQVTLSQVSNTACDNFFDGQITVTASTASGPGVGANYDFVWTNDPDGLALPAFSASDSPNTPSPYSTPNTDLIGDSAIPYAIDVRNVITSCVSSATIVLLKNTVPTEIVSVTATDVDVCLPMAANGTGTIDDVKIGVTTGQSALFDFTWDDDPLFGSAFATNDPTLNQTGLNIGTFYVRARRIPVSSPATPGITGSGCFTASIPFDILNKRITPTVSLSQISSTACDSFFDGQITVTASTASGPGVGANYDFVWTNDPDGLALPAFSASDSPNTPSPYSTPNTDLIGDSAIPYTIDVRNVATSCVSSGSIVILKNTVLMEIVSVTATDVDVCLPMPVNGTGTVDDVKIGVTTGQSALFDFTWDDDPLFGSAFATNDPTLNQTGLDIGTFYVRARRIAIPSPATPGITGSGCFTAPMPFDILNKRITPTVSLSQIPNSACIGPFDGQITVTASTASGPGVGANYDFVWTNDPDGLATLGFSASDSPNTPSPYSTPNTDLIGEGSYSINVLNVTTSCVTSGTIIVQKNPALIEITALKSDKTICVPPDGSSTVTSITMNGTPDADHTNFDFIWYSPDQTTVIVPQTQGNDALTGLDNGTYFVKAIRRSVTLPGPTKGGGCESTPFRLDILDVSQDPDLAFTAIRADSSCNPMNPLGLIEATAIERDGTTAAYTFNWTLGGAPVGPPPNTSPTSQLTNAAAGNYIVTVTNTPTGCTFTQGVTLTLDTVRSLPSIVKVVVTDPLDCNGSGSALVTEITVGGTTTFTEPPDDLDVGFAYEWRRAGLPTIITTNHDINNLAHGVYFVNVRQTTSGCASTVVEVVVDSASIVYPEIAARQTSPQVICNTALGASAALAATVDLDKPVNSRNNLANFEFSWYPNLDTLGVPFALPLSDTTIINRPEGNYSVKVRDVTTNCKAKAIFIIESDTTEFKPVLSLASGPLTECDSIDGYILARGVHFAANSTTPQAEIYPFVVYNYAADFYTGAPPDLDNPGPDLPVVAVVLAANSENFTQPNLIGEQLYTVRMNDLNTGCSSADTISVHDLRIYPKPSVISISPVTNCDPLRPNGVAQAGIPNAGGVLEFVGYSFEWFEGNIPTGLPLFTGPEYGELKVVPQVYTVRATNLITGCSDSTQTTSLDGTVAIAQPDIEILSLVTSCDPANPNGALRASVEGNSFNYTFDWYDGIIAPPIPADSSFSGVIYDSLAIGFYGVRATSKITGCKSFNSEELTPLPQFPDLDFQIHKATCGQENGSVNLIISSSIAIDTVQWFEGFGALSGNEIAGAEGPLLSERPSGQYSVLVTTILGCHSQKDVEISSEIHPFNGISNQSTPGQNDYFHIDCIELFTKDEGARNDNVVRIYNRAGTLVYEAHGYDNVETYFDGKSNKGVSPMGTNLPDGTYFYIVDKRDGSKSVAGYLEIVK